jgi:nicotinamidase-related amidase
MLMDAGAAQLLVVDMQARLMPAIAGAEAIVANARIALGAAAALGVPVTISEQYPTGLGPTVADLGVAGVEPLAKTEFSCLANAALAARLAAAGRPQLVLLGAEAHVCVLQTALDAAAGGYAVFVLADAVGSRRVESRDHGLRRMAAEGVRVVTTEMLVFEWLRDAQSPHFRALSRLIR